jgi:hypothetical protein
MCPAQDYIKRRSMPPDLKCRVVLPSGAVSVSVWDAPSQEALQEWLDTNLASSEPGLVSTCHEVQVRSRSYACMGTGLPHASMHPGPPSLYHLLRH